MVRHFAPAASSAFMIPDPAPRALRDRTALPPGSRRDMPSLLSCLKWRPFWECLVLSSGVGPAIPARVAAGPAATAEAPGGWGGGADADDLPVVEAVVQRGEHRQRGDGHHSTRQGIPSGGPRSHSGCAAVLVKSAPQILSCPSPLSPPLTLPLVGGNLETHMFTLSMNI